MFAGASLWRGIASAASSRAANVRAAVAPGRLSGGGRAVLCILFAAGATALANAEPGDGPVEHYRAYMIQDIDRALLGARELRDRIAAHDLRGAQAAWINARVGWERSEVFTGGFVPALDAAIDAWPDATSGFHAIEAKLFGADPSGVGEETDALVRHLTDLDTQLRQMKLTSQGLLNGIVRLAYEVGDSKVDGGESRFSGTSLSDMRNNVDGIELAYQTLFASAVSARDPNTDEQVRSEIKELKALLTAADLKRIDPDKLRKASETLIVTLQAAGPEIGLSVPTLEDTAR
jgi:iron uptake system component EfeO